jgi:hypothetical protein
LSLACKRGIATLGGSGLAVGNAEGDGDGLGVLACFFPPKRPACALGVVATIPNAQATEIKAMSPNCFKRPVL